MIHDIERKRVSSNLFTKNTIYHKNTHGNWTLSPGVHERAINSNSENVIRKLVQVFPCVLLTCCRVEVRMYVYVCTLVEYMGKHSCVRGVKLVEFICIQQNCLFFWWDPIFQWDLLLYTTYVAVIKVMKIKITQRRLTFHCHV